MSVKIVILVVAFEGYQQMEYLNTKKVLEEAGYTVKTASINKGAAIAKDGSTCQVDFTLDEISPTKYAGIFLIGGPGALNDLNTLKMQHIINETYDKHIPVGAICISTRILANAGILDGKRATGWNGDNELDAIYKKHDVKYVKEEAVTDGLVITATGPESADAFGKAIVALIGN
jgi:protease I